MTSSEATATTARDAIAGVLADFAFDHWPEGMRPGDGDPDWECPWEMNELNWYGFADAVLSLLTGHGVRLLCGSEYREPLGGWATCSLPAFHEGDHDGDDYAWSDADAWSPDDDGSSGPQS